MKKLFKFLYYKKHYHQAQVAFNSCIIPVTSLGKNTKIASGSTIYNSSIGEEVNIYEFCSISNANLEKNVQIYPRCHLHNVSLGRFSYISQNSILNLTEIGNFCSFGPYLICGFGEHPTDFLSTSPVFFSTLKQCGVSFSSENFFQETKKITIGHDVWIGARVFIRDGVKIGHGVIIAAGSVVVKDVPDYAIVGGVPAKVIRFRFSNEIIQELLKIQWWNWPENHLRKAQLYFTKKDVTSFIKWVYEEYLNFDTEDYNLYQPSEISVF
jgi:chloramphenicol O-acetyltransferase type B